MKLQNIILHKILIPIDGSRPSYKALSYAIDIARNKDITLTLLYVAEPQKEISDFERVSLGGYIPDNIKTKGYELLSELLQEIPSDIKTQIFVEIGSPAEIIVDKAQTEQFDMIIMGSRGLSKLKSIFMGSVSQYTLQYAHCPVLIIR